MKFEEVIPLLRAGKKVRRKRWFDKDYGISLDEDGYFIDSPMRFNVEVLFDLFSKEDDWEELKEKPKPISTETIEWFRPSDKMPELHVAINFFALNEIHYGKLIIKHNGEKKYFKDYISRDLYLLIQVDAWAYAPNGGGNET